MILLKSSSNCNNYPEKIQTPQGQKKLIQPLFSGSPQPENNIFFEKKARKEKKKKFCLKQAWKNLSNSVTGFNTTNTNSGRDLNQIVYYNYNKKEHLLKNCSEPKKNIFKN